MVVMTIQSHERSIVDNPI